MLDASFDSILGTLIALCALYLKLPLVSRSFPSSQISSFFLVETITNALACSWCFRIHLPLRYYIEAYIIFISHAIVLSRYFHLLLASLVLLISGILAFDTDTERVVGRYFPYVFASLSCLQTALFIAKYRHPTMGWRMVIVPWLVMGCGRVLTTWHLNWVEEEKRSLVWWVEKMGPAVVGAVGGGLVVLKHAYLKIKGVMETKEGKVEKKEEVKRGKTKVGRKKQRTASPETPVRRSPRLSQRS